MTDRFVPLKDEILQRSIDSIRTQREKVLVKIGIITDHLQKHPMSDGGNKDLKILTLQLSQLDKTLKSFKGKYN